ncbi:Fic family protein [Patescibacteria group bacterium]|nr:Fic family protein [Patescibacteria group bacterium]MCL5409500.1 Fic family protein [Patescibacteria group bacterium]
MAEITTVTPPQELQLDVGVFQEGIELVIDLSRAVPEGTRRGIRLIGEIAADRKRKFDERLVKELNQKIMYYMPGIAGEYRTEGEDVRLRGREKVDGDISSVEYPLITGLELRDRMYAYGQWLEERTTELKADQNRNDVIKALLIACEASYGLVSPGLHPFREGNGRTARLLANGILMANATELNFYGIRLLPIPLVRESSYGSRSDVSEKVDPYILALNYAHRTKDLSPYILLTANLWRNNLTALILDYQTATKNGRFHELIAADKYLLGRFETRLDALQQFIIAQDPKNNPARHIVPMYKPSRFSSGF